MLNWYLSSKKARMGKPNKYKSTKMKAYSSTMSLMLWVVACIVAAAEEETGAVVLITAAGDGETSVVTVTGTGSTGGTDGEADILGCCYYSYS
jgi:hypothetical protein